MLSRAARAAASMYDRQGSSHALQKGRKEACQVPKAAYLGIGCEDFAMRRTFVQKRSMPLIALLVGSER